MKRIDDFINRLNFKILTEIYLTISLIVLILCGCVAAYSVRDKIYMTLDYEKASEIFKKHGFEDALRSQLDKLSSDSRDIVNIIALDKDNNIFFKANNNLLGTNNKFTLEPYGINDKYLKDNINKNTLYRITSAEAFILNKNYIENNKKINETINDEFSYERDLSNNNVYFFNYMIDKNTNTKIFIIGTITPIPYAEVLLEFLGIIIGVIFALYWIGLALWVYKDANKKHSNAALWGLLVLVTNLGGLIIYTIFKQNSKVCHNCGLMQNKENIFCNYCGAKISDSCNKCGNIIHSGEHYCNKCGNEVKT